MPCTCPLTAWPPPPDAPNRKLVWSPARSYAGAKPITVPCGRCDSCRLTRSRTWATRIVHEAQQHDASWFGTVTYAPEHLPADLSVSVREHQLFMKRMRERLGDARFFMRGEYGETFGRPHYHYCWFGLELPDARPWKQAPGGETLFRSAELEAAWGKGQVLVGAVTVQSAAYVAGYVNKKAMGEAGSDPYRRVNPETGETWCVAPEFVRMSRRPGIGASWFDRFKGDAFPSDFVVIDGQRRPVPRYYRDKLSEAEALRLVAPRRAAARRKAADNTDARLMARHESARLRARRRTRDLDGEA